MRSVTRVMLAASVSALLGALWAEDLVEKKAYRTDVVLSEVSADGTNFDLKVGANSKFVVLSAEKDHYLVAFRNVYAVAVSSPPAVPAAPAAGAPAPVLVLKSTDITSPVSYQQSPVVEGQSYYLKKTVGTPPVPLDRLVERVNGGMVSGPLVVPFKLRTKDGTLTGDATLGYYAGYGFDMYWNGGFSGLVVTPIISAGLSQIGVVSDASADTPQNKSGFTWAAGLMLVNWDKVNIGVLYGEDRIGDKTWKYEGDGWCSFSLGWSL